MKKYKCVNMDCKCQCEVRSNIEPNNCLQRNFLESDWQEMGADLQPNLQDKPLPKLTAEVFDREDCPKWAKWVAVSKFGRLTFFEKKPVLGNNSFLPLGENHTTNYRNEPGEWDATDWQNSLIERPAKLPEWCKVGEWCYCKDIKGYAKINKGTCGWDLDFCGTLLMNRSDGYMKNECVPARLRPYNFNELKDLLGKAVSNDSAVGLITGYDIATIRVFGKFIPLGIFCKTFHYVDGKPCGVLEHMENGEWVE